MDHKLILKQRHDFYNEIKNKVEFYLGKTNKSIASYKKTYLNEIHKLQPKKTTANDFFDTLKKTQILLFGDFHSEPQSIRSLLRVCRKHKASKIALGIECIHFKHQALLEKFQSGLISESDFTGQMNWNKNWDFPFSFIKPLLQWASAHEVAVYGINSEETKLMRRDQKIASNIQKIVQKNPDKLLIVQIGDYHLAKKHLPLQILKRMPGLQLQTVFQSPDELYFKMMRDKKQVPDFIRFNKNQWAIMAVLPWVKWQNYLLWLESSTTYQIDEEIDLTDHVARCVQFISETLKIKTDTAEISIYALTDLVTHSEFKKLDKVCKMKIKNEIEDHKSFFVPELKKGYLDNFSLNHISRLAAEYLMYKQNIYTKTIGDSEKLFLSLIWIEMLTYFFTKIVNPKRKTNTVFDLRAFLMSEKFEDHGKDVLAIALEQKLKEMGSSINSQFDSKKRLVRRNKKSYRLAARLLGGIMGEKVFWAYSHRRLKFPEAQNFLFQNIYHKSFRIKYYDLVEVIEQWPNISKSKFDQF